MIDIISEPSDQTYLSLLNFAKQFCTSFSLIWQDKMSFAESATVLEISLRPFLIREDKTNEWPGTKLLRTSAIIRYYQLTDDSAAILAKAQSLYAWLSPNLPEDLAFYTKDSKCWLLTIAHEKDAAFDCTSFSLQELRNAVPELIVKERNE